MLPQLIKWCTLVQSDAEPKAHVPPRFIDAVAGHVVHNALFPDVASLILAIIGATGTGKSWQAREIARQLGWAAIELNASALAGDREGIVVRMLHDAYARAIKALDKHAHSFLLIDDFDLSMASIRSNVETSQHTQLLISALMELCDRPEPIRTQHPRRVPIILTTNSLDAVYAPLIRYGRMHVFHWAPEPAELISILDRMFPGTPAAVRLAIAERFGGVGLGFFRELRSELLKQLVVARLRRNGGAANPIDARDVEAEFDGAPIEAFYALGARILESRKKLTYLRT